MPDVIVIGGGIIGTAVGYHTADRGRDTLVFDRADDGAATAAGAGIVSPETSRHASEDWYRLAMRAADYYPTIDAELRAAGADETGFATPGTLVVDPAAYEPSPYRDGVERVFARQQRHDHPDPGTLERISGAEARRSVPPLAETRGAISYTDGGRVDGSTFRDALRTAADPDRFGWREAAVTAIRTEGDRVSGVETTAGRYDADAVVVAGGAWSPTFAGDLEFDVPVSPERGQIIRLAVDARTEDWPIVNTFQGYYLVPWDDGTVSMGATREAGAGFEPRVTPAGLREITGALESIASGLADATVVDTAVGLRPASADGLPLLGPVPSIEGAYLATGHGSTGLQLGPYSGMVLAAMIDGEAPPVDPDPYLPARFDDP